MNRPALRFCGLLLLTLGGACLEGAFERPSENERMRALGNLYELPEKVRPLFTPDADFPLVPRPGPNDWLSYHREPGQTFDEFRENVAHRPEAARRIVYLLPIGEFPEEISQPFEELRTYAAAFFQMEVRVLTAYHPHDLEFTPRQNPLGGQRQVLTTDILAWLKERLPDDAYCLLGVTMADLYPSRSWNYVFGQASLEERVGIYSLARYDPAFWGDERGTRYQDAILQRACKVLVHETAHMFGLWHCIYFECVVNGSNHLAETDRAPQHLCPVCFRKLYHAIGFDPVKRYEDLARFYQTRQWFDELDFANRQLTRLRTP